jgi:methionyl-tRNA formyltransferase
MACWPSASSTNRSSERHRVRRSPVATQADPDQEQAGQAGPRHGMKLIFAGTPGIRRAGAAAIVAAGHEVALVLTQPDRPAGRGMALQPSPVKKLALEKWDRGLPAADPEGCRGAGENCGRGRRGDGGGGLWPDPAAGGARHAALRLHQHPCFAVAALARGGADPARLLAGDAETGRLHHADGGRAGYRPGAAARGFPDCADDTTVTLHDRLAGLGATLIVEALGKLPLPAEAASRPRA